MAKQDTSITIELRARGLRVTAPRHATLDWLSSHPHATVAQVHQGVRAKLGTLSNQAAYDVLSVCVNAGLVRRIQPAGHAARFERRTHDNHHHVVCRECGRIEDSGCRTESAPCLSPAHDHGFRIEEAEIVFWGLCDACLSHAAAPKGDEPTGVRGTNSR